MILDRDSAALAAEKLKVFAQGQRLLILSVLVNKELSVSAIDEQTGIRQPALSQQLAELRRAKLVLQRRVAKQVLYRLSDDRTTIIVNFIGEVFARSSEPGKMLLIQQKQEIPPLQRHSAAVFPVIEPA